MAVIKIILRCVNSTGSGLFFFGSVVAWPEIWDTGVPDSIPGWFYTIGSVLFTSVTMTSAILHPASAPWRFYKNAICLRSLFTLFGNILFILGSIYFLPGFDQVVGNHLFIAGCVFICANQVIGVWAVNYRNNFTKELHDSMQPYGNLFYLVSFKFFMCGFTFFIGCLDLIQS